MIEFAAGSAVTLFLVWAGSGVLRAIASAKRERRITRDNIIKDWIRDEKWKLESEINDLERKLRGLSIEVAKKADKEDEHAVI